MSEPIIRVEHYQWGVQRPDAWFDTIEEAARTAAVACDENTSWYGEARDIVTGETWSRTELLDLGYSYAEGTE